MRTRSLELEPLKKTRLAWTIYEKHSFGFWVLGSWGLGVLRFWGFGGFGVCEFGGFGGVYGVSVLPGLGGVLGLGVARGPTGSQKSFEACVLPLSSGVLPPCA